MILLLIFAVFLEIAQGKLCSDMLGMHVTAYKLYRNEEKFQQEKYEIRLKIHCNRTLDGYVTLQSVLSASENQPIRVRVNGKKEAYFEKEIEVQGITPNLDTTYLLKYTIVNSDIEPAYCTFTSPSYTVGEIVKNKTAYPEPKIEYYLGDDGIQLYWDILDVVNSTENNVTLLIFKDTKKIKINQDEGTTFIRHAWALNKSTKIEAHFMDQYTREGPKYKMTFDGTMWRESIEVATPSTPRLAVFAWVVVGLGCFMIISLIAWFAWRQPPLNGPHAGMDFHRNWHTEFNPLYFIEGTKNYQQNEDPFSRKITLSELRYVQKLGAGHFGQVELNYWITRKHPQGILVAVKTFKTVEGHTDNELRQYINEVNIFRKVGNHPNIVKFLGHNVEMHPWFIVTEFMEYGDLSNHLISLREHYKNRFANQSNSELNKPSDEEESRPLSRNVLPESSLSNADLEYFGKEIASGMAHLEYCQVVHRDLAARNVLLGRNKTVKITDFGLSREGAYCNSSKAELPIRWMAPETFERNYMCTSKSDIWSFAVVLWEIGTLGGLPYDNMGVPQLMAFIRDGRRLAQPELIRDSLYRLMQRCWEYDPNNRPTFQDILVDFKTMSEYFEFSDLHPNYEFPAIYQNVP